MKWTNTWREAEKNGHLARTTSPTRGQVMPTLLTYEPYAHPSVLHKTQFSGSFATWFLARFLPGVAVGIRWRGGGLFPPLSRSPSFSLTGHLKGRCLSLHSARLEAVVPLHDFSSWDYGGLGAGSPFSEPLFLAVPFPPAGSPNPTVFLILSKVSPLSLLSLSLPAVT